MSPSPPQTATATPTVGEVANLTAADNGTTLHVRVTATINVQLTATPGYRWSLPSSTAPSIVAASMAQASDGGATGTFRSLAPGSAELRAVDDPTCLPTCGRPSRLWHVMVVVTPHPVP